MPVETTIPITLSMPWAAPIQCSAMVIATPSISRVTGTDRPASRTVRSMKSRSG